MAGAARDRASRELSWERSLDLLREVYRSLPPADTGSAALLPTEEDRDVRGPEDAQVALA